MDHHAVAIVSIAGICLDVLGGLYLAYDLLGGRNGPLRLLTRMVTYSIVFGVGYAIGLGIVFGVASGIATGLTLAIELRRAARCHDHYPWGWEFFFSAVRGAAFGAALSRTVGVPFGVAFGALITLGQGFAYWRGMRPGMEYVADRRPRLTRRQFWGSVVRTVGYIAAALMCSATVRTVDHEWSFALRIGLVTGLVTTFGVAVGPFIEYYADNLPERRMGVVGIALLLCGFVLQSVQYWVSIPDIPVT